MPNIFKLTKVKAIENKCIMFQFLIPNFKGWHIKKHYPCQYMIMLKRYISMIKINSIYYKPNTTSKKKKMNIFTLMTSKHLRTDMFYVPTKGSCQNVSCFDMANILCFFPLPSQLQLNGRLPPTPHPPPTPDKWKAYGIPQSNET